MKLGFLLFEYFPFGGLQRDCLKIAELCAARGHDVMIFTRAWDGDKPTTVRVARLGRRGWTNVARNRAYVNEVARMLPHQSLDGVIGFNKMPGLDVYYGADPCYVAKVKRLKPFWHKWLPRYRHFAEAEQSVFARGQHTQVLMLTNDEIQHYEKFYGTEPERFHVLPPGVERRTFTPTEKLDMRKLIRSEQGWPAEDRLLLFVGSGFRVKGLDRAIRAFAALDDPERTHSRLVVIGQDSSKEFAGLAKQLGVGDRVHFMGGRYDVYEWMLAADLLVHPARSEAAGMILLEALTAGLPVLTTDVCGYAFHIQRADAGQILASPFNQEACNAAVQKMPGSSQRPKWSTNGIAYAAREDLYSCHERAADLIETFVKNKSQ